MAQGIILRHTGGLSNQLWVVENSKHRYTDGGYDCNICIGVHHVGKTSHLWLEPSGTCIVSKGVYRELLWAGMPSLEVAGHVNAPPPLRVGPNSDRQAIDNDNRKILMLEPIGAKQ